MDKIDYSIFAFPKGKNLVKKKKKQKVSKSTYDEVFEICKGRCVLCGVQRELELHHIKGRGKDLTDNIENCVMLCRKCHHEIVHKNQKKYRPLLLKIRGEIDARNMERHKKL